MTVHARFRQSRAVLTRGISNEVWAAVPGRESHALTDTTLVIWDLLEVPRTLPDLLTIASVTYSVKPADIARDIDGLVDDMLAKGLIEEVEEADI